MFSTRPNNRGDLYAVTMGDYLGQFFIYMEQKDNTHVFLSLPDFHVINVKNGDFEDGVDKKILDFREKLPTRIFKDCYKKYKKIKLHGKENPNNRLK